MRRHEIRLQVNPSRRHTRSRLRERSMVLRHSGNVAGIRGHYILNVAEARLSPLPKRSAVASGWNVLVATTNYESILDRAVWRRFGETLCFDRPDEVQLLRLLALKLSGVSRDFELNERPILEPFQGLSHAEIERVLRRAVKEMVLAGREFLERKHVEAALKREQGLRG